MKNGHDLEALSAYAEGRLSSEERARVVSHLGECLSCRQTLAAYARAITAMSEARPAAAAYGGWRVWGLAAAAVLLVSLAVPFLMRRGMGPDEARISRAPLDAKAVTGLSPSGELGALPEILRWQPVATAQVYKVRVFTEDGALLWERDATDAAVRWPTGVQPGAVRLFWRVEAIADGAIIARSDLAPLTLKPAK